MRFQRHAIDVIVTKVTKQLTTILSIRHHQATPDSQVWKLNTIIYTFQHLLDLLKVSVIRSLMDNYDCSTIHNSECISSFLHNNHHAKMEPEFPCIQVSCLVTTMKV